MISRAWLAAAGGVAVLIVVLVVVVVVRGSAPPSSVGTPAVGRQPESPPPLDRERVARGGQIYTRYCIGCHGENGIGENPSDLYAVDEQGSYPAPPLDASAHAWHHTDEELVEFISSGSPRNPRMSAWKDVLDGEQIRDVVEYVKSLWGPQERICQGPRHMDPDCLAAEPAAEGMAHRLAV